MSSSNNGFDYSGHLVFNEVCRTSNSDDDVFGDTVNDAEARLLDMLPRYDENSFQSPQGYEKLLIRDYLEQSRLSPETKSYLRSVVSLQYKYDEYEETEAYVDGELKSVQVPDTKDANIFWDRENYMLFRGAETDAEKAKGQTQVAATNQHIHSITFSGDFLLWLFYRAHDDTSDLPGKLKIHRLTDAEVTGTPDDFGGEAVIHDSDNIKKSAAILLGIIEGKDFFQLEGDLEIVFDSNSEDQDYTRATLRTDIRRNKIKIKASKAGLKNANKVEKLSLASQMVFEIARLYDHWENMPADSSDKFVPPTFIVQLIRTCQSKDIDYTATPRERLREQARKRGEDLDDYDFSL